QPWSTDPFALTDIDGRLYGRGTADMKGFIAATIKALSTLDVTRFDRELLLIWTYDEEVGCLGSAHLVSDLIAADRPVPSACLIGEPTNFQVMRMHSGHHVIEVDIEGTAAHSSRPDLGCNAIVGAAATIRTIEELAKKLASQPRDIPEMSHPIVAVNIGTIQGGSAVNIVPDRCRIQVGFRPLPGMDKQEFALTLDAHLERQTGPWKITTALQHGIDSMLTPAGTDLERLLLPHASTPNAGAAGFATDGGNLAKLGTQPLVFGPGSIDVAHKANEYVERSALDRAVQVLRSVILARCVKR
ncbi:MAG: acetylornithine deacetylase, partial [Kiritimatiellia bacterium]